MVGCKQPNRVWVNNVIVMVTPAWVEGGICWDNNSNWPIMLLPFIVAVAWVGVVK